jgi:hypothetical protein
MDIFRWQNVVGTVLFLASTIFATAGLGKYRETGDKKCLRPWCFVVAVLLDLVALYLEPERLLILVVLVLLGAGFLHARSLALRQGDQRDAKFALIFAIFCFLSGVAAYFTM